MVHVLAESLELAEQDRVLKADRVAVASQGKQLAGLEEHALRELLGQRDPLAAFTVQPCGLGLQQEANAAVCAGQGKLVAGLGHIRWPC